MEKSALWQDITDRFFKNINPGVLKDFRRPDSINSRLASWSPTDNTARHFKFLIWNALETAPDSLFEYIIRIRNRSVGDPVTVRYNGIDIDIDYMLAADELVFLEQTKTLSKVKSVIEIGAGFGRTAHAVIENFLNIEEYTIIDLPEVLDLSKIYLKTVIPDQFSRLKFINAFDDYKIVNADLFINIDSFQEMYPDTIMEYYEHVISRCAYIYIKNPVGKYYPEEFLIKGALSDKPLHLGLCQQVYTVCDQDQHADMVEKYLNAYSFGKLKKKNDSRCALFHYYHHALYTNPRQDEID